MKRENIKKSQIHSHRRWMLHAEAQRQAQSLRMDTVAAFGPCKLRGPEEPLLARGPGKPRLLFQATCCLLPLPALDAWGVGRRNYFPELQLGEGQLATLLAQPPSSVSSSQQWTGKPCSILSVLWSAADAGRMLSPAWVYCSFYECAMLPMSLLCSP